MTSTFFAIEHQDEELLLFAVTTLGDHAVFMSMPSMGSDVPVAAFGAPHQLDPQYVEFRFKGGVCCTARGTGSAQRRIAKKTPNIRSRAAAYHIRSAQWTIPCLSKELFL